MEATLKRAQSIVGTSEGRPALDFYPTPPEATKALLAREQFPGLIWEPACGDGAIVRLLPNPESVIASDIADRGFGEVGVDFLTECRNVDHIITNPPFRLAQEFAEHALACASGKVALLAKLQFLEGRKRLSFFREHPPRTVYVFSSRLKGMNRDGGESKNGSMLAFAWFVWEKGYKGLPQIDWI